MFGPRNTKGNNDESNATPEAASPASPARAVAEIAQPRMSPARAEIARIGQPSSNRRTPSNGSEERTLKVGKGLSLAGEITSCDVLVVEGKVEAKLNEGKMLEIAEAGQFRGSVEIENADIAGRFDGQLLVHGRLTVRSTGRISGMVKYSELEVNAGGQIIGEMQVAGANAQGNGFKTAAKFLEEEAEDRKPEQQRKTA